MNVSGDRGPAHALVDAIRADLAARADSDIAAGQQAYMKSAMPFRGVRMPAVRSLVKGVVADQTDADLLQEVSATLWREASYREERYAAIAVLGQRAVADRLQLVVRCQEMITTGAWWDLVDATSARVARLLRTHRAEVTPVIRRWARADDMWLRRAAIISQLGAKGQTDRDLLREAITENLSDSDFFVRKAIGWALRDFARTDPAWVRAQVTELPLSSLSRREALKQIGR